MMFKVLVLQTLYTLFDDATEYQLKDRLSAAAMSAFTATFYALWYLFIPRQWSMSAE